MYTAANITMNAHCHPGVLVIVCLHVCTVRVWCIGSGFPFYFHLLTSIIYLYKVL